MKKIIMLAAVMVFLWTGISFAENWIMWFEGKEVFNAFFDADRVVKRGNGYDYWTRDVYSPEYERFLGDKYFVRHQQVELRNGEWWICRLEDWRISSQGMQRDYHDYTAKPMCQPMTWANREDGRALLDGLRKYAR